MKRTFQPSKKRDQINMDLEKECKLQTGKKSLQEEEQKEEKS